MANPIVSNEFMGRLVVSYKDGETIYAYDEITRGLYKFSIYNKEVSIVLSSESIFRNSFDAIMGISKRYNEIILIPLFLDSEWIFYDIKEKKVRYDCPIKKRVRISSTITIDMNLFLIPSDIYSPIITCSLDDMKVIKIHEKWYRPGKEDGGTRVWGTSSCKNLIAIPIINSNCICCMNIENIAIITPQIYDTIHSVSICKDRIWILPNIEKAIYASNLEGDIIEKVSLSQIKSETITGKFIRIIATEESVFLLPSYGEDMYVYLCKEKQIVHIDLKDRYFLQGRLFAQNLAPYWDFVIENKMLHLLPRDCRYRMIDICSIENKERNLYYGENIDCNKYWNMAVANQKDCMFEKRKGELKEFFQYMFCFEAEHTLKRKEKIGTHIWKNVVKE